MTKIMAKRIQPPTQSRSKKFQWRNLLEIFDEHRSQRPRFCARFVGARASVTRQHFCVQAFRAISSIIK